MLTDAVAFVYLEEPVTKGKGGTQPLPTFPRKDLNEDRWTLGAQDLACAQHNTGFSPFDIHLDKDWLGSRLQCPIVQGDYLHGL